MSEHSKILIAAHPQLRGAYRLETEQHIPANLEQVFDFFGDARQLEEITPPWLHFSVLTPPPIEMRPGTLIDYRLRLRGLPLRWRTKITAWEPGVRFVDEQLRGPYRLWRHEHTFESDDDGTLVRDRVDYSVPGGRLAHRLLVRSDLVKIFAYRREALERCFGSQLSA